MLQLCNFKKSFSFWKSVVNCTIPRSKGRTEKSLRTLPVCGEWLYYAVVKLKVKRSA